MLVTKIRNVYNRQSVLRNHLRDTRRIIDDPLRYAQRRRLLSRLDAPEIAIPRDSGFVVTSADRIPGLAPLQETLRQIADDRFENLDREAFDAGVRAGAVKPFYFNLLEREDVVRWPQLLGFALSRGMLSIVGHYCGLLPELSHMAIFYSGLEGAEACDKVRGTQTLHWDNHDFSHVKFFCFLDDVGEDDGPLTVLPADKSAWFRKKTGRRFGTWPVRDDAELFRYFSESDLIPVVGPAGTTALVDTTNCLHFGSRTSGTGRRRTFVIHYTRFADYGTARTTRFQDLNLATSPECRAVVPHDRLAGMAYRLVEAAGEPRRR